MKKISLAALGLLLVALVSAWLAPLSATTWTVPAGAITPKIASSGNVAAATATATITGAANKMTYLEGFDITSSGSTAGTVVTVTVTGSGATQSYTYTSIAGVALTNPVLSIRFPTPIPSSATNTNFVVSMPTLGSGNTNATIVAYGYLQ